MTEGGIALFGGSFNPIHIGHLIIARDVAEQLGVERFILTPSPQPPHKEGGGLAGAAHRLEMARRAVEGETLLEVSDIETRRSGPSYTFDTVNAFRQDLGPDVPLYWVIGADSLPELHAWYRIADLAGLCRIVTARRPGFESPDLRSLEQLVGPERLEQIRKWILTTPMIDVSATEIRRRVAERKSIRYLVPESVRSYITDQGLYRDAEQVSRGCCH